jgi:hypothetical protein
LQVKQLFQSDSESFIPFLYSAPLPVIAAACALLPSMRSEVNTILLTWGAIECAVVLSSLFFGFVTMQVFIYHQKYPQDKWSLKALVRRTLMSMSITLTNLSLNVRWLLCGTYQFNVYSTGRLISDNLGFSNWPTLSVSCTGFTWRPSHNAVRSHWTSLKVSEYHTSSAVQAMLSSR